MSTTFMCHLPNCGAASTATTKCSRKNRVSATGTHRAFRSDVGGARFLGKQGGGLFSWLAADQVPRAHRALALDVDAAALLQHELVLEALVHRLGQLDSAHRVGGFHSGRDIDSVSPHVI